MVAARFIYPSGSLSDMVVNVIDRLDVTYTSQWDKLNITVFCQQSTTSNNEWFPHAEKSNPILANGTYIIPSIKSLGFAITQYPVDCHCSLVQYQNNSNRVDGGAFRLTSTAGTVKTFQPQTSSGTTHSTQTATATSVVTSTSSQMTTSASPTTTFSSAPPTTIKSSSGLSGGAAAGIGVGVGLSVVLLAAIFGYWVWSQKRPKRSVFTKQRWAASDYNRHARSDKKEYVKPELPADGTVVRNVYESDSQPLRRQDSMMREDIPYPISYG